MPQKHKVKVSIDRVKEIMVEMEEILEKIVKERWDMDQTNLDIMEGLISRYRSACATFEISGNNATRKWKITDVSLKKMKITTKGDVIDAFADTIRGFDNSTLSIFENVTNDLSITLRTREIRKLIDNGTIPLGN